MAGWIDDELIPCVQLHVHGQSWTAVIDTGFNGDLELPESLRRRLHPRFLIIARSLLAGGMVVDEPLFQVAFPFDGQIMEAEATFVEGTEILVGTHLLRHHRLFVDFVARTVSVERAGDSS